MAPTIGVSPRGRMIHEMAMRKLETGRHQLAPVPAPPPSRLGPNLWPPTTVALCANNEGGYSLGAHLLMSAWGGSVVRDVIFPLLTLVCAGYGVDICNLEGDRPPLLTCARLHVPQVDIQTGQKEGIRHRSTSGCASLCKRMHHRRWRARKSRAQSGKKRKKRRPSSGSRERGATPD